MTIDKPFAGLVKILVDKEAGVLSGSDVIHWASAMISIGYDSPSLRHLAGFDYRESLAECERFFLNALRELNLRIPSRDILMRFFIYDVAHSIVSDNLHVFIALEIIHSRLGAVLGNIDDYVEWSYLWEGLHPGTLEKIDESEIIELTRQYAVEYLSDGDNKPAEAYFMPSVKEQMNESDLSD